MLSFRLDSQLLHKVDLLRHIRHRSRGEIIRDALELYFRVYIPTVPNPKLADEAGQDS
jgi:hypothetical protein